MSSYEPESSSIEKFIISATYFIFIMSSYLSPIQSYNPFCDKIHAFNELLSHLPYEVRHFRGVVPPPPKNITDLVLHHDCNKNSFCAIFLNSSSASLSLASYNWASVKI